MGKKTPSISRPGAYKIIAVFAVVFAIALIYIFSLGPKAPAVLVQNQTYDSYEDLFFTYEINRYPANAEVSNLSGENPAIGFSIDPWNLNFGIVPSGGSFGKRQITLTNSENERVLVRLKSYGDSARFVEFSSNGFALESMASAPVGITFRTEKDTAVGNYNGEIDIIIRQPKYGILRWFE